MSFQLILFLGLLTSVKSFCFRDLPVSVVSLDGSTGQHCMYKGTRMEVGGHLKSEDCIECDCEVTGLSCCGYGIKAGVIQPPAGCQVIADGCTPVLVKADDKTRDCFSGEKLSVLKNKQL